MLSKKLWNTGFYDKQDFLMLFEQIWTKKETVFFKLNLTGSINRIAEFADVVQLLCFGPKIPFLGNFGPKIDYLFKLKLGT